MKTFRIRLSRKDIIVVDIDAQTEACAVESVKTYLETGNSSVVSVIKKHRNPSYTIREVKEVLL
jgi:hypothetical protein